MNHKLKIMSTVWTASFLLAASHLTAETVPSLRGEVEGKSSIPSDVTHSTINRAEKVSDLMGKEVRNLQNEKVGKVDNLIVDLSAGRIIAVVITTGGFLGLGDELSVVPPIALHYTADNSNLQLDVTKEALSNAPHFKASEWPDMSKGDYAGSVYSAYKVEPYFSAKGAQKTENTSRNTLERNTTTLTPLDQGSSKNDLEITTQIRKGILAKEGLSINAQNVKIITTEGRVTLRGPVANEDEKRLIGELAIKATRKESVDNQLEVK